jgi:hypothetical protein
VYDACCAEAVPWAAGTPGDTAMATARKSDMRTSRGGLVRDAGIA